MKKIIENFKRQANQLNEKKIDLMFDFNNFFSGMRFEIICPHYNGQAYGTSKPKLKGKIFKYERGMSYFSYGQIWLFVPGHRTSIEFKNVKFLGG